MPNQNHPYRLSNENFRCAGALRRAGPATENWQFSDLPKLRFPSPDPVSRALLRRCSSNEKKPEKYSFPKILKQLQKHLNAFVG
jgi:hypothetical protein